MRIIIQTTFTFLLWLVVGGLALGERAMPPDYLALGYDEEGKIDTSPEACLALVKEVTQWNETDTQRGAREVCAARLKHVAAYSTLQASYKIFIQEVMKDGRYDWGEAAATVPTLVKTCINHKFSITTGGHNIQIDIIKNEIVAGCLMLAADLMREETRELAARRDNAGCRPRR
jgi:hypothetical protein